MALRLGELCAGYNGLGMAVEEVFGATPAWFSEYDAAPSKILAHHYPDVPNYGDMTAIDWAAIEPADIISGGTPCQDLSAAGKRKGMTEGTRSNLWVQMREAIAIQRPQYVVWENVRGAYSATATSDLEQCPGCMGDTTDRGPVLRALGRVLGDLADLGFNAEWRGLRAADVGACHGRFRVFILAVDASRLGRGESDLPTRISATIPHWATLPHEPDTRRVRPEQPITQDAHLATGGEWRQSAPGQAESGRTRPDTRGRSGTPTPDAESVGRGKGRPEPAGIKRGLSTSGDSSPTTDAERMRGERRGIDGDLVGASGEGQTDRRKRERDGHATDHSQPIDWGEYAPAIARWESVMGRRAPAPTEPTGRDGGHRLSPKLTEWMMGLPDGWVTDPAIGISRNDQLKACGNGVVPHQATAALRDMLAAFNQQEPS